ncbi:phosphoglycerate kinase [Candidatus Riesia sp. GBBU]|nr:phosphoglycerate kinase [Candidatus Riesia sp. GBBU]
MEVIRISEVNLKNKVVLIRSDLNVPIENKQIVSDVRILKSLKTIKFALKSGANVIIASHLGRPIEGKYENKYSLEPVAKYLSNKLNRNVPLIKNYLNGIKHFYDNPILLENVRFNIGEKENNEKLSKIYSSLCDIYVIDSFGSAHRKHSSTFGVGEFSSTVCAGFLFYKEIESLEKILESPKRPMVAIIGGSKVSTKLSMLGSLIRIADQIIVGGGIANTFISSYGYNIGNSLYEKSMIEKSKSLLKFGKILIPIDVKTENYRKYNRITERLIDEVKNEEKILDFGRKTIQKIEKILKSAKTILWNGPVGMFERKEFRKGTEKIARLISESDAFSVAGGGDTISAIDLFRLRNKISYISTGGGAFMKFVSDRELPSLKILKKFFKKYKNN